MPRKRMIDPEYWSDEEIASWSFRARLFYIGLWNFADDEGRMKAHPKLLKSQIFPYEDKIDIQNLKNEVSEKVQWYEVNQQQYGFVINFLDYQRIDRPTPSKLPPSPPFDEASSKPRRHVPPNISKVKLSKDKLNAWFEEIWEEYPHKTSKAKANEYFNKSINSIEDFERIKKALVNYKKLLNTEKDWRKPQDGKTWFNPKEWQSWVDYTPPLTEEEKKRKAKVERLLNE